MKSAWEDTYVIVEPGIVNLEYAIKLKYINLEIQST